MEVGFAPLVIRIKPKVLYFVAECPILNNIRFKLLGIFFTQEEFIFYSNGEDWSYFSKFLREAGFYRWEMIQEFHF